MQYRREIDGLRAIAVLPVILFHAGFSIFSGGFVGVDVFFVISGFLITNVLIAEQESGHFSIAKFYERRARRILPAFYFILAICLPFSYFWMLPSQFKDFSESLVASILFVSNLLFLSKVGYFAPDAELQPLLHTWSLAIEEQYYLIFPLIFLAISNLRFRTKSSVVLLIVIISFIFSEWASREYEGQNFFFTLSRFWEIGVGSLCSYVSAGRIRKPNNVLSLFGLLLILASIFLYDNSFSFPSSYAIAPVFGTALILLFANQSTWVGKILGLRIFVRIGLISYSAYLWHQPIFAFARLRSFNEPSQILMGILAAGSLLLAWATWRYVEQPFRRRENALLPSRRGVFTASGGAFGLFLILGLFVYFEDGFEWRLGDKQREVFMHGQPVSFNCIEISNCLLGDLNGEYSGVAFVGDSHMERYAYLLNTIMTENHTSARLIARSWCAPLLLWQSSMSKRCGGKSGNEFQESFYDILEDDQIHTVVLAAEWANYTTGYRHGSEAISYDFSGDENKNNSIDGNEREFDLAVSWTVSELVSSGKKVFIIGPVPEYEFDVALVALRHSLFDEVNFDPFILSREDYIERNSSVFSSFAGIVKDATIIDVWPLMCEEKSCSPFTSNGFPLYSDKNHLVSEGMKGVVGLILSELKL